MGGGGAEEDELLEGEGGVGVFGVVVKGGLWLREYVWWGEIVVVE